MPSPLQHFQDEILRQRDRWILWIPVAIGIGVGGYFSLHSEPPHWLGISVLFFLLAPLALFYKNKGAVLAWLPFMLIALGFTAAQWRTWSVAAPALEYRTRAVMVQGRVTASEDMPKGFRFTLDRVQYPPNPRYPNDPVPAAVRLTSRVHEPPPVVGDTVKVLAVLQPLSSPVAPGAYDFQRKAFFDGIGATGYTLGRVETTATVPHDTFFFAALRRYIRTHIEAQIGDKDEAAMTAGMLIGESKGISEASWENIRLSGLAHLLAISGLNTSVMTGWLFFLIRWVLAAIPGIALHYPVKKISAALSMVGVIFFLCLVNFSLPAERAVIMACVVMTAVILDRDPFSLRLLAFAAILILLLQPESLVSASFQMSFAAVAVLIAFYESTRNWWGKRREDKRWFMRIGLLIAGSIATTGAATLGTAPYSLFHFLRVPVISGFLANLVAVPIVVVITLPVGVIACLLMPLGLEALPLKIVGWSMTAILKIAEATAHWPYTSITSIRTDGWPMPLLLLMTFGGLWICLWRGWLRWLGLVPALAGAVSIPLTPRADVLIAENGKLAAVRSSDGSLLLSPGRADKFVRDAWTAREGGGVSGQWPGEKGASILYETDGHTIAFIQDKADLPRACAKADIVLSGLYIDQALCPTAHLIIDRKALKKSDAHALYFKKDGTLTVKTTRMDRGIRPWTGLVH